MFREKRRTIGSVGTVLKKIPNPEILKQWVDFICTQEPWSTLGINAATLFEILQKPEFKWQIFVAANPKDAKSQGFDFEDGLIVFSSEGALPIEQNILKNSTPLSGGAFIFLNYGKPNHKTVTKYMLSAAERIISDKTKSVFALAPQDDTIAARIYKPSNYEERATVQGILGTNDAYSLLSKVLE